MNLNYAPILLLVALCWMSVGNYAQTTNSTTMAPNATTSNVNATTMAPSNTTMMANATTMAPSNTSMMANATTMAATNATSMQPSNATTPMSSGNATAMASSSSAATPSANSTAHSTAMGGSNATSAPATTGSANSSDATTMGSNSSTAAGKTSTTSPAMTTRATTAAGSSSTMTTAATTATTAAATTAAPPLVPNTNVTALSSNLSRSDCGSSKLCAAQPADCEPTSDSCFFAGAKGIGGRNMQFGVAGKTSGYLCMTLTPQNGGNETAYIFAKKNSNEAVFICADLLNGQLIEKTCLVNNVKVMVKGDQIQGLFDATLPDSTTRAASPNVFALSLQTGTFNATSGSLGTPTPQLKTNPVNLNNATANTSNTLNSTVTTAAPTVSTTAGAITLQQCISKALLILLGVVSLAWL